MSNPFEASRADLRGTEEFEGDGPWQHDGDVLATSGVVWPRRCPTCGSADVVEPPVKIAAQWHPRWVYFLALVGLVPYLIASAVTRKYGSAQVFLCAAHRQRRTVAQTVMAVSAIAMLGGFAIGVFGDDPRWTLRGLLALAPLLVALYVGRVYRVAKIDGTLLHLRGVHPDFVASLPHRR
jgi:hypothetical protein